MARGPEVSNDLYRPHRMSMWGIASDVGTGTASSSAVTINDYFGLVTTESLTTAQAAVATVTLTNSKVEVGDLVLATLGNGTNTQGTPVLTSATVTASTVTFKISNMHASDQALNGTLKIAFMVVKSL